MRYTLGIDVSTTATKALLLDESGSVADCCAHEYGFATPQPLWAEQDPELWWHATTVAIRTVLARSGVDQQHIAAVGLTGQMHGLVLVDARGEVIRPAILWNDQRAAAQCLQLRELVGAQRLVEITGNDAFAGFSAPKLLWVREHEPENYARIAQVLLPKDWVRYQLIGSYATDRAGAGGTLLLDLATRDWSQPLLQALDVPPAWLPPTHEGTALTGEVSARAAAQTGLAAGTPVVGGAGDQAAQAVGVGAVDEGTVALTLGTSGVVFAPARRPVVEPRGRLHAFPHALAQRWHVMGVMLSAAGSLRWFRDALAPGVSFAQLDADAAAVGIGSEGLVFLPYLSGERTPHADANARGAFVGLTLVHRRGHLVRAVLEGVAQALRDNLDLLRDVGVGEIGEVRISGGGAKSDLWCQILADTLEVPLVRSAAMEAAALGAALLAGLGVGVWPDAAAACSAAVHTGERFAPDAQAAPRYGALRRRFCDLYPALRADFRRTVAESAGS